jgi:hypothetical protein
MIPNIPVCGRLHWGGGDWDNPDNAHFSGQQEDERMKAKRMMIGTLLAAIFVASSALADDKTIADRKFNLGIEIGLPLIFGPQIGVLPDPHVMLSAGFMQIGTFTIISLEGRYNLKPDNFRPYFCLGYDRYGVKDDDDATEGTINLMHAGFGIEYAWDFGLALGVELNYIKAMSATAKSGDLSETDSLVDEDVAVFLPNLQIRAYF